MDYPSSPLMLRLLLCITMIFNVECVKVSFFGGSHITMPMQEAKASTNIRLRFRTHQEHAMLMLAAGRTDYCLLNLDEGRLQFRININDTLVEMWSPKRLTFNDREWHDVSIQRYESNVTVQIDEHIVRKALPGRFKATVMNIQFGVFLGGPGDYSASYLSSVENLRGCISDVYYNSINVLKRAKEGTLHATGEGVAWTCSPEFDADESSPISFVQPMAHVVLAKPPVHTGESWTMEFRTIEPTTTLLYNSGPDFVGLEVVDRRARLLVGKGSNVVELVADADVSDGQWHNVSISYGPSAVELTIDAITQRASFANGSSQIIELGEEYLVGGIIGYRRRRALGRKLKAVDHSFQGCVRNLAVDRQPVGFPHFKITQGVRVGCVWRYPCLGRSPCVPSGRCQQFGVDSFNCLCEQAFCVRADYAEPYKIFTRSDMLSELELVAVTPLQVLEGHAHFLTTAHVEVMLDYGKFEIPEGGVVFSVSQPPKHGRISIVNGPPTTDAAPADSPTGGTTNATLQAQQQQQRFFSLVDLSTDKVKYVHGGDEHFSDHMAIDMQLMDARSAAALPDYLDRKHRFVLHVNVTPVNDAPVLSIVANRMLRLTQGIPKAIGADLLMVSDPDSEPEALMYSVLVPADSVAQHGRIEVAGKAVVQFSQADVNAGLVTYLMETQTYEPITFELAVSVSDGIETSPVVYLPVSVVPLQLRMINNTGLVLVHKASAIITPWNLSFSSNSEEDNVDIRFTIVQAPLFGSVQKLRTVDNSWVNVESFTSDLIQLGHIRYLHNIDFPVHDDFKFIASFGQYNTIKYDFRLTFTKLRIGLQVHNSLLINGTRETTITAQHLFHQTTPLPTFARNIIYTVVHPPKYGQISVTGHGAPSNARESDSFTQQDIDKNLIVYRTHRTSFSSFVDIFEFTVTVPECEDVSAVIKMVYNPADELAQSLSYQSREELQLSEGARAQLSRRNFQVSFDRFDDLLFRISTQPQHGRLCASVRGGDSLELLETTLNSFTLQQLYATEVFYCHDDTETIADRIDFLVVSDELTDFQFVCSVLIAIQPINDNGPTLVGDPDAVFRVVRNQSRVLSGTALRYTDPDVSPDQTDHIVYTQIAATNGDLYLAGILADSFTQTDMDRGRVLFRHWGAEDNGTVGFAVSDGFFDVSGVLSVVASDPFITISARNASVVQEGRHIVLTLADLAIETNVNADGDEIEYQVLGDPNYGVLRMLRTDGEVGGSTAATAVTLPRSANSTSVTNFTQADVRDLRVAYWNTGVASMDRIRYRVTTKGIGAEGEILIRIYPSAYWDLLQIRMNQTLYVEESTSVKISRKILEIVHPNISPGDITYLVTTSPQHGYLEIQSITSDDEYNCKVFDQSTVNAEKMFYIQAGVNQSSDQFVFDVTNGITWLRGLVLKIVIIPESLYVTARNISVDEGQTVRLEPDDMLPYAEYYQGKILEYKILVQPQFGQLKAGKSKVNRFTFKQLESGQVQYVHDGSENGTDLIRFMAIARNKESVPFDLWLDIVPVNDELPQVVTNTGLQMWVGGSTAIRTSDLMAQDYDTPANQLTFIVVHIIGGQLSRRDSVARPSLTNFTQADINQELLRFTHDHSQPDGELRFVLSDGTHRTAEQTLYITTKPVSLELMHNNLLHVFPLTRKQLQPDQLQFRCSDVSREVRFIVTVPPKYGRLVMDDGVGGGGDTGEVIEFTQQDVQLGHVLYEHTHAMIELRSNDSFYFDVTSQLANSLHDQLFQIEISVSSGGLLRFLPVPRLRLDEGAMAPIHLDLSKVQEYLEKQANIAEPELYVEAYRPRNGKILIYESPAAATGSSSAAPSSSSQANANTSDSRIMLDIFSAGRVYYQHDHSDTVEDTIQMSVYLMQGQLFLCNLTLPVIINPINDQSFALVTQSPQMSVVEGENRTIGRGELLTEDQDTSPAEIVYDVISGPTLGALCKLSADGGAQDLLVYGNQFTQADINAERIQYQHFGVAQSTTFYFKVSDGHFKPAYEIFNLRVLPVTLTSGLEREIVVVQQGANSAVIEAKHLPVETNARRSRLVYNVTETPRFGQIMLDDRRTGQFGQEQLDGGRVSFVQTDMAQSSDAFKVNVFIPDSNHSAAIQFDVKVIVEPLIKINGISITSDDKIRLTSTLLFDNPTQSKLNRYNPKITITRKPDHGRIRKIIRTSGGDATEVVLNDRDVTAFTYKELKSGIVFFVARRLPAEVDSINDYFEYTLYIKSVQPGQGFVPIEIHKMPVHTAIGGSAADTTGNGRADGPDGSGVNLAAHEPFPFNYVVLLGLVAVVMVLGILMAVLIRCRSARVDKQHPDAHAKGYPPPLPRPPDFMTLNSHPRGMYQQSSSESGGCVGGLDSLPVTAASTPLPVLSSIPHCKVIPIDLDDDEPDDDDEEDEGGSESDEMIDMERQQLHNGGRYPYGDEHDEWSSSCDVNGGGDGALGPEVTYASINQAQQMALQQQQMLLQQKQQRLANPLLRRNQYWV